MIDFHSHILPEMDDGSESVDLTRKMLRASAQDGVTEIVATPHFYADQENPSDFLKRREEARQKVLPLYGSFDGLPAMRMGAEVRYFDGMSIASGMERLCIQGTSLMLVEMPFRSWTESMLRELSGLQERGIMPILAHVDRYNAFRDDALLRRLRAEEIYLQLNADALLRGLRSWRAIRRVGKLEVDILGSDCHSMGQRSPNLQKAQEIIVRRCGDHVMERLTRNAEKLLRE